MSRALLFLLAFSLLAGCTASWEPPATTPSASTSSTTSTSQAVPPSTGTPPPPPPPTGEPSFAAVAVVPPGKFDPVQVTVNAGSTVTWSNCDGARHSVTSDEKGGPLDGDLPAGGQFEHKFEAAGTFAYHCEFHPNMVGQITVN